MSNLLTILVGPTCSGKTTLINALLKTQSNLHTITTATTRPPREGETNGLDYYFLTEKEFKAKLKAGEFLETEQIHGKHWYGSPKAEVDNKLERGNCVMALGVLGAQVVKSKYPNAITIFLSSTEDEVRSRLIARKTDEDEMRVRLASMQKEKYMQQFCDYTIKSKSQVQTYFETLSIINKHCLKLPGAGKIETPNQRTQSKQ